MASMTGSAKRYRLQVPAADESVQKWLAEQLNISTSLRQLIREDIQRNGYTDVTCRAVEQGPKRGRPTNAEMERKLEQKLEQIDAETGTENGTENGTKRRQEQMMNQAPNPQPQASVVTQQPFAGMSSGNKAGEAASGNEDILNSVLG